LKGTAPAGGPEVTPRESARRTSGTAATYAQLLRRDVVTLVPLVFEPRPRLVEALREIVQQLRHERVRLADRGTRIVDEVRLQRMPAVAELVRPPAVEQRLEPSADAALGRVVACDRLVGVCVDEVARLDPFVGHRAASVVWWVSTSSSKSSR
jgi:hypothetical protein